MSLNGLSHAGAIQDVLNKLADIRSRTAPALTVPGSTLTTGRIAEASPNGLSFVNALKNSLDAVNHDQNQVSELSKAYDLGNPNVDLSDVMVAVQKANVSFQSAVQVRNRLVSAYHDMMNMQI